MPVAACTRARPLAAMVKSSDEYIIAFVGGLICERRDGVESEVAEQRRG